MDTLDKHTWTLTAGGHELAVERFSDGSISATWGGKPMGASAEQALGRECLRLAEENRGLKEILAAIQRADAIEVPRLDAVELRTANRDLAATCPHHEMIATQEGPLGV